jgi:addiction module RelE/StbE family toxin
MKIFWTNAALDNLLAIYDYVAQASPFYADKLTKRLVERSEQLEVFPLSGRIVPELSNPDIREVIEGAYRILYKVKTDSIDVIAVVHSAQNLK